MPERPNRNGLDKFIPFEPRKTPHKQWHILGKSKTKYVPFHEKYPKTIVFTYVVLIIAIIQVYSQKKAKKLEAQNTPQAQEIHNNQFNYNQQNQPIVGQPFKKMVRNYFPISAEKSGEISISSNNMDAVVIVRDKYSNQLYVYAYLPKNEKMEISAPLGSYNIFYISNHYGDPWQGEGKLFGYRTVYLKSPYEHEIYKENLNHGGYRIHGTGLILDSPHGGTPAEKLSKKEFYNYQAK